MGVKVITPEFRASYVFIAPPKIDDDNREVYKLCMIFDKSTLSADDLALFQNAIKKAAAEKWGTDQSKWPRNLRVPLRDADKEDRTDSNSDSFAQEYVNAYFINAKTFSAPGLVDESVTPIEDLTQFYSGCYGRASVVFSAYDKGGAKGVGCYLNNLMKTRDGERLAGGAPASADFAAFKTESPTGAASAAFDDDIPF